MTYRGVAISGKAGAGKTTLARHLCELLPRAEVTSFAGPLKSEVWAKHRVRKTDPGGREKLIEVGEARRYDDPLYWIKLVECDVWRAWQWGRVPVIDDVRFVLEAEWLRALGFYMVRLEVPAAERADRLESLGLDPAHAYATVENETALDSWPGFHHVFKYAPAPADAARNIVAVARGLTC